MAKKNKKNRPEMCHISGLWWNESKGGEEYLAGYMGNSRILIFHGSGDGENSPDMNMYVVPKQEDDDSRGKGKRRGRRSGRSRR